MLMTAYLLDADSADRPMHYLVTPYPGLYFVEAPTRRDACPADLMSADHNATMAAVNDSVSGTIVDGGLHQTEPNSSTAETTFMYVSTVCRNFNFSTVVRRHSTISFCHFIYFCFSSVAIRLSYCFAQITQNAVTVYKGAVDTQ